MTKTYTAKNHLTVVHAAVSHRDLRTSFEATLRAIVLAAVIDLVDVPSLVTLYRFHVRAPTASTPAQRALTSSPHWQRSSACSSSTRCPTSSSESACLSCCSSTAHRDRTSPFWQRAERQRPIERRRATSAQRAQGAIVVLRCESALFFANADAVRDAIRANIDEHTRELYSRQPCRHRRQSPCSPNSPRTSVTTASSSPSHATSPASESSCGSARPKRHWRDIRP